MKAAIKIPSVGESITEATISEWKKKDGDLVQRDEILMVLETDKASVEVVAEHAGRLSVKTNEGETVAIGAVVGEIDTSVSAGEATKAAPKTPPPPPAETKASAPPKSSTPPPPPPRQSPAASAMSPAVQRLVVENQLDTKDIRASGPMGNLTKGDVLEHLKTPSAPSRVPTPSQTKPTPLPTPRSGTVAQGQTREPMSKLRQTIARRLVEAQHTAAILTTFNEIDMSEVMNLRTRYKEDFKKRYNVSLGFMGFFVKASIEALKTYPRINGFIEGTEVVLNHFHNIGVAVGTEKGLMVPVIRNADFLSLADIELSIRHYAEKARDGKMGPDDLAGGTFTISNGGVYGSLLSTPILNPPQSGILGLHKIEERPIARDGQVVIRPMMYIALSYDHRMVDGKEAVSFLVKVKECMEDPARLLLEI